MIHPPVGFALALTALLTAACNGGDVPKLELPSISDRSIWTGFPPDKVANWIESARREEAKKLPPYSEDLFLEFSRTGERGAFDRRHGAVISRYQALVLGELAENQGSFLDAIIDATEEILDEPTWVLSAHDSSLDAFYHRAPVVDLASSSRGMILSLVSVLLEPILPEELVARMRSEVQSRVLEPYLDAAVSGEIPRGLWWMTTTNNWNAVCHNGVVTAALAIENDPEKRTKILEGMNQYLSFFIDGFTDDGYCTEGMGYWNYGFGNFVMLSEFLRRASGGREDLLNTRKVVSISLFPFRLELTRDTYPIFADGVIGTRPSPVLLDYLARRLEAIEALYTSRLEPGAGSLLDVLSYGLAGDPTPISLKGFSDLDPMRDLFPDAGVITMRPGPTDARLSVALKAGHNDEHHNHNDVGSLVIAMDDTHLVLDPGGEVYTARTFGPDRYLSDVLNSYGHSVPRVGGRLQSTGREFQGAILETEFSDQTDRVVIDLAPAYELEGLLGLTREVRYSRVGSGTVTLTDSVALDHAESFESALISYGHFEQTGPHSGLLYQGEAALALEWTSRPVEVEVSTVEIQGRLHHRSQPMRIAFTTIEPATAAAITIEFRAAESPVSDKVDMSAHAPQTDRALRIQAESFIQESGGAVMISGKVNADGLAFLNWDDEGHTLTWDFVVERAGDYALRLRYCHAVPGNSIREITLSGTVGNWSAVFPPTGGWSGFSDDWETVYAGAEGQPVIVRLEAGPQTLTMVNTNGASLNLDWIELVPVTP